MFRTELNIKKIVFFVEYYENLFVQDDADLANDVNTILDDWPPEEREQDENEEQSLSLLTRKEKEPLCQQESSKEQDLEKSENEMIEEMIE